MPREAADEIERLLAGPASSTAGTTVAEEDETQVDLLFKDVQNKAFESIKDKINKFEWGLNAPDARRKLSNRVCQK